MDIRFNRAPFTGREKEHIDRVIASGRLCGDGEYSKKCEGWIRENTKASGVYLTTSCTQALEMSALLAGIQPGDEVILPSYTFVSTANAFVLRGANLVFVDIRPDTCNIDESLIEEAITEKTKAIVPVHYAGVGCEMDSILEIAEARGLMVIEDAAQGMMSSYRGRALGTMGDYGCFSFHETKNYSMGEGGAILIKDPEKKETAEIVREKGTDRSRFLRGQVDKYTWVSAGSSYLPSELSAAYLWPQLEDAEKINDQRLASWHAYYDGLKDLEEAEKLKLPVIPGDCVHNAHMFYIRVKDLEERTRMIGHLKEKGVQAVFHYVPLHSAEAGRKYGRFAGEDRYTTKISESLLRLPMYYGLTEEEVDRVVDAVRSFYR